MKAALDIGRLRRMNVTLLLTMAALAAVGVAFIRSACALRDHPALRELYVQHAEIAVLGLGVYFAIAYVNYQAVLRWSALFYIGAMGLLVAVLFIGTAQMGAQRWVFGIQPSEVAKLATVMAVAQLVGRRGARHGTGAYVATLALLALPVALVMLQPDLGTALVFVPTVFAMLFAAAVAPRAFWLTILAGVVAAVAVVALVAAAENPGLAPHTRARLLAVTGLTKYQHRRLAHFLFPERYPDGGAWTKRQSEIAVGSGGVWGKGYRQGDQNMLGYLPPSVASNDFIFSVLAEEVGFMGSLAVLLLYAGLLAAVLAVGFACPDGAGRLVCVGVGAMVFCHVGVNIAMTVGLLPVTGLPLPFVSYGRTCLLTMMAALGLVQSVAVHGRRTAARF